MPGRSVGASRSRRDGLASTSKRRRCERIFSSQPKSATSSSCCSEENSAPTCALKESVRLSPQPDGAFPARPNGREGLAENRNRCEHCRTMAQSRSDSPLLFEIIERPDFAFERKAKKEGLW